MYSQSGAVRAALGRTRPAVVLDGRSTAGRIMRAGSAVQHGGARRAQRARAAAGEPRSSTARLSSRGVILLLFLFSGVSGLVYEVVWSRMFTLVLGCTVYAVAAVLGVFMGGLALGSWIFGRVADRPGIHGLRLYGWLEVGIGAFALVLPVLVSFSDHLYRAAWPSVADSPAALTALRLLLATMILIVPATLMGGTLPVLSRFLIRTRTRTGTEIGGLYALNTLGAVLGCLLAGFVLLEYLGVRYSLLAAACVNFAVGSVAIAWSLRGTAPQIPKTASEPAPPNVRHYAPWQVRLALVLYAFSGFAALALEVLWTRSLLYFTSVDTYAFTAMLAAFLCGLGLGSLIMAPLVGRVREPLLVLGVIQALIGISAAASIPLFAHLYGVFASVAEAVPPATLAAKLVLKLACSFGVMLVPTLLMGAAFPLVSAIYVGARRQVGRSVGNLYALNTVGAIAGSVTAGFVLIPVLGLERGVLACASVYVVLGLVLCAAVPRTRTRRVAGVIGLACGLLLLGIVNHGFAGKPMVMHSWFFKEPGKMHRLIAFHEDASASLAVLENPAGTRLLNINGVTTAINNHLDMLVHRMLSHLPILLHPAPRDVLVVGFGMGSTPWGCCQHPEVARVDVVELLRAERETAQYFEDINHGVLRHPKLRFLEGDGRNYLLATRQHYDVISFNAIHPRYSAYLYTRDFYALCGQRLTPQGVICAWMTQNSMTETEFRMLLRSFVEVFPQASLWYCNPEHFCLVGTMTPTRVDLADWTRRMAVPAVRADLAGSSLADPLELASRYMCGPAVLAAYVAGAPLNTDDRPRIEFARESRTEQRPIIARLLGLSESVRTLLPGERADAVPAQLAAYEQAASHVRLGQMEHWYPAEAGPLRPEIEYRRALLACPESEEVRHNLVFSAQIKADVEQTLRAQPGNVGALTRAGVIMLEEGRRAQAENYLLQALQFDNDFVPAMEYLGLVQLLDNRPGESIRWLRAALAARPGANARIQYALAVALERLGSPDEAARWRAAALEADAEVAAWFELLTRTVELLGKQTMAGS